MKANQIWRLAQVELQNKVTRANYDTWVKNVRMLAYTEDTVVLGAPNAFAKEWLEDKLLRDIESALGRVVGHPVAVRVQISMSAPRHRATVESTDSQDQTVESTSSSHETWPEPLSDLGKSADVSPSFAGNGEWHPNPRYTFSTFVPGKNSELAFAAAQAVADRPAKDYNPLFIYGGVGLGKTHLQHAIAHRALSQGLKVCYVSSEQFTNELINAIRDRRTPEFRNRYRGTDILLIDDIQFIAGKDSTQEEFFHTFNALYEANKQIVLSSDKPPRGLPTLEERLRSRFEWGLIVDVQPPDLETRIAILRAKAPSDAPRVPVQVMEYVAQRVQRNIRELEGALVRIVAYARIHKRPITMDLATKALGDLLSNPAKRFITTTQVLDLTAKHYRIDPRDLRGKKRTKDLAEARQVAMFLMREDTDSSLQDIGRELGGRDHSTVLHGYDKIRTEMVVDDRLRQDVMTIREALYSSTGRR